MTENENCEQEPLLEEEMLRDEGETVIDAFMRYQKDAAREVKLALEALLPDGTRVHGRAAKRAFRRAFKVVLDEVSARLEFQDDEEETPPSTTGPTKIKVEVS